MYYKNYSKILKLICYVYIFIMVFISFLLMFNNIINIIFYSYYKYNNKFIVNDVKNLYVYETYTYKLFISMLKDNLENYNNLYFTLNTSSNLLKIFIIFTIVFVTILTLSDTYLLILEIDEDNTSVIPYVAIIFCFLFMVIYYSLIFIIDYRELLITFVVIWIVISIIVIFRLHSDNKGQKEFVSIYFLIITFFKQENDSKDENFKTRFYYTILIFVIIIWLLLILSYTIFEGKNSSMISYEKYCFDICNDKQYNSLENYFHNTYLKNISYSNMMELNKKLEDHNIYTIDKILMFSKQEYASSYPKELDEFITEIIKISVILKREEYDYNKYDKLDFVKLVNIFIKNELIYMNRNYDKNNDLYKDLNYLFNNDKVNKEETYNIENVLIAAFPVDYINNKVIVIQ